MKSFLSFVDYLIESNLVDEFLNSTKEKFSKRDTCGPACIDFISWAKREKGIDLTRVRGEFVADEVVHDKADFTPQMKKEFMQSGLDWNSAKDRKKWIEQSKYAKEWKRVPHYWTIDKKGNIHDPSGYQQLVATGLAKNLNSSRYISEDIKIKEMKTYQQLISELFDKKIDLDDMTKEYDEDSVTYYFSTPKGQEVEVSIIGDSFGDFEFSFQTDSSPPDDPSGKTGQGEEFLIFATVLHIYEEFLKIEEFPNFYLESKLSEKSRVSLYRRLLAKFKEKYPQYKVTETTKSPKAMRGYIRFDAKVKQK